MRHAVSIIVGAIAAISSASLTAQQMEAAQMQAQPLTYIRDGRIHSCGIRVFGVSSDPGRSSMIGWDGSLNLSRSGFGIVKGLGFRVEKNREEIAIRRFWLKVQNQPATQPIDGKHLPGEGHALLYIIRFDKAVATLRAILEREQLIVGIQRGDEDTERLYYGTPGLTEAEIIQVVRCLEELVPQVGK